MMNQLSTHSLNMSQRAVILSEDFGPHKKEKTPHMGLRLLTSSSALTLMFLWNIKYQLL
jgi:hypothetical protein